MKTIMMNNGMKMDVEKKTFTGKISPLQGRYPGMALVVAFGRKTAPISDVVRTYGKKGEIDNV